MVYGVVAVNFTGPSSLAESPLCLFAFRPDPPVLENITQYDRSVTLTWTPPNSYSNQLQIYYIYQYSSPINYSVRDQYWVGPYSGEGNLTHPIDHVDPPTCNYTINDTTPGLWYYAIIASNHIDNANFYSNFSNCLNYSVSLVPYQPDLNQPASPLRMVLSH